MSGPAPSHCPSTARPRPFAAIRLTFRCSSVSISLHFIDTPLPIRDRSLPFLDLSLQFRNRFAALPPRPPPGMMVDSLFARDAGKAAGDSTACSCHCCLPMLLQLQLVLVLLVLATADAAVPATADAAVPAAAAAAACCCCLLLLLAAATVIIMYAVATFHHCPQKPTNCQIDSSDTCSCCSDALHHLGSRDRRLCGGWPGEHLAAAIHIENATAAVRSGEPLQA